MFTIRTQIFALSILALTGCAGAEVATSVSAEAKSLCVQSFERQRTCGETFLPALVDLRVRLDKPSGIAAAAKSEGRDVLIATAREEWRADSTDEAIANTCSSMVSDMSAEHAQPMMSAMNNCLAKQGCDAFVPCQIELIGAQLSR